MSVGTLDGVIGMNGGGVLGGSAAGGGVVRVGFPTTPLSQSLIEREAAAMAVIGNILPAGDFHIDYLGNGVRQPIHQKSF